MHIHIQSHDNQGLKARTYNVIIMALNEIGLLFYGIIIGSFVGWIGNVYSTLFVEMKMEKWKAGGLEKTYYLARNIFWGVAGIFTLGFILTYFFS